MVFFSRSLQVERIHYMSLIINANWRIHSSSIIEFIPVGTIFEVQATFHDYLGNQFHSGPKQLHVRLNRCDIIQVKKSTKDATIELRTIQTGFVVMKFWADGIEKTTDYVKFHVEQSVKPVVVNNCFFHHKKILFCMSKILPFFLIETFNIWRYNMYVNTCN